MLPLLHGQSFEHANQRLNALGLKARRVPPSTPCNSELQLNQVLSQYPEPGTWLPVGSQVTLVTCSPSIVSREREVPELSGLTMGQAKIKLQQLNLRLRYSFNTGCTDPFLQNKIVKQLPEAASKVARGSIVWVSICQGAP